MGREENSTPRRAVTFLWPHMLWLAIAPAVVILIRALHARKLRSLNITETWPNIRRGAVEGGRVHIARDADEESRIPWRFWLAFVLVIIALARPQWGHLEQSAQAPSGEVLIALDLSRSMLAADIAPSRLDRARALATRLVDELPGHKIGLIGFAGAAFLLAPPSDDRVTLQAFLPTVTPDHMIQQGTSFDALLDVALAAFSPTAAGRCLVIVTDGEAESAAWRERLPDLRQNNIRVITVGFGTPAGANVPATDGEWVRDRSGSLVRSRLNAATLSELAQETEGEYLNAERYMELTALVRAASTEPSSDVFDGAAAAEGHPADRFAWFLGAALLLLMWSAAGEWPARPRIGRFGTPVTQTALAGVGALLIASALHSQVSNVPRITPDPYEGEGDPLVTVVEVVAQLIDKEEIGAADYLELANAAIRYGEVHRNHSHPLSEGVLHDGVAAVEQGRLLDPALTNWNALEEKLKRLLVPPPPVPDEDRSPHDPANEPLEAKLDVRVASEEQREGEEEPQPTDEEDDSETATDQQDQRSVGGSRRDVYDPQEWQNASLVLPLHQLEQLRGTGSPVELFRFMQDHTARASRDGGQVW